MEFIDVRYDLGNEFPWDRIEFRYSYVGDQAVLISTKRVFDTGVTRTDGVRLEDSFFQPGTFTDDPLELQDVVRFRTIEDGNFHLGENTAPWAIIEETTIRPGDELLTENGLVTNPSDISEVTKRTVTYDTGNQTYFEFLNGTLRTKIIFDGEANFSNVAPGVGQGSKPWYAVTQQFDVNGDVEAKAISYDNGIVQADQFSNGFLTTRTLFDGLNTPGDGTKPWTSIVTEFDTTGVVTSKLTFYDDFRQFAETYSDGVLSQAILTIPQIPDVCSFTNTPDCPDEPAERVSRTTDFDANGKRAQQISEFSDGDVSGFIFTDGQITEKQFYDGDGDEDWLVLRLLLTDGQITDVIEYSAPDEVPDEVIVLPDLPTQPSFFI